MNINIFPTFSPVYSDVIQKLCEIEHACFNEDEAFSDEMMPKLVNNSSIIVLAYDNTKLIGYGLARDAFGVGYLYSNAVLPAYRKQGIGTKILDIRIYQLRKVRQCNLVQAHTRTNNRESAKLLFKFGFLPIKYEPDFYEENSDAILWEKNLL